MQCWDEHQYSNYCPDNDKIYELTYSSLKDKFKRKEILQNSIKEAIKKESNGYDYFCTWNELVIWNGGGSFCIGKKGDKKLTEGFSYQDQNNIHILEAAIRAFWKRGGHKLSSLLEQ